MGNFFRKINIENFRESIFGVFKRTPLSMFFALSVFVLIVVMIRVDDISQELKNILFKVVFSLGLSFFFSVAVYLFVESKKIAETKKWLYQIATLIFGLLFYYFFEENLFTNPETEIIVYLILTSIGIIAFVFIAPFICKLREKNLRQEEFYSATYNLFIKILMSIIVGLATMFLGFIAFSAIFALFDLDFAKEGNWFGYWASFSLALFTPTFFLANLPFVKEKEGLSEIQSNKFYSFLINYVGLPAISIYFLILYSYTVKVLINFSEWPHGEVSWLVILFSFFGYLVYFATYAFVDKFRPAEILRKFLPMAVLLQTFMLFYAIGLRINQYDLTINRYLVVAFGLWLFGLSLYFIISKKKSLATPFYSLLIVVIFISIGPWSVYIVPEWRQLNNLEANLRQANILQDGDNIVPLENYLDISAELSGEIYGGIEYLSNSHGYHSLDKIFRAEIQAIKKKDKENFEENKRKNIERAETGYSNAEQIQYLKNQEYRGIRNWTIISRLSDKIKVRRYVEELEQNKVLKNFTFRNSNSFINGDVNVSGYDYYVQVSSEKPDKGMLLDMSETIDREEDLPKMYSAVLDSDLGVLDLYYGENIEETFQIKETVIKSLLAKKDDSLESRNNKAGILLPSEDMTFELSGINYDIKIVLRNISIRNPEWVSSESEIDKDSIRMKTPTILPYINGYVLIKKK